MEGEGGRWERGGEGVKTNKVQVNNSLVPKCSEDNLHVHAQPWYKAKGKHVY